MSRPTVVDSTNYSGRTGRRRLLQALQSQQLIGTDENLAKRVVKAGTVRFLKAKEHLSEQGAQDNDIHLILGGKVSIRVNKRDVATREAGTHVGEMALVDPLSRRSATIEAIEDTAVFTIPEHRFTRLAQSDSRLWRRIAVEIARRLRERSRFIPTPRAEPEVFIGSSSEGLKVAEGLYKYLSKKPVVPKLWSNGVFEASSTTIETLARTAENSDFAVLILTPDDTVYSRGKAQSTPRDNVVFELGLLMGTLGRERVMMAHPKRVDMRLPSDLLGVTVLHYSRGGPRRNSARLRAMCQQVLRRINKLGPR